MKAPHARGHRSRLAVRSPRRRQAIPPAPTGKPPDRAVAASRPQAAGGPRLVPIDSRVPDRVNAVHGAAIPLGRMSIDSPATRVAKRCIFDSTSSSRSSSTLSLRDSPAMSYSGLAAETEVFGQASCARAAESSGIPTSIADDAVKRTSRCAARRVISKTLLQRSRSVNRNPLDQCPATCMAGRYQVSRSQSAMRPTCCDVSIGAAPSSATPKLGIRSLVSP
jgi:hypothetical protein